jgi:hypothetical protein
MNTLIAQSGGSNITCPTPDWSTLIPQLVGYFFDAVGKTIDDTLHHSFDSVWTSSGNVLGQTDLGMTWSFGAIHDQVMSVHDASRAVLLFALVLLGLKSILGGLVHSHSDVIGDFVNAVLASVIMVAAFPIVIPLVIGAVNQAAGVVGSTDISQYISSGSTENSLVQAVLFIILLFYGMRLLIKAAWRIGFLAVLLPVGMAACALYAIPATRWLLGWWSRVWGGMLIAQIPSVMALSIGVQLAAHGSGMGAFVFSIAFLQLATDLYTLIPFGSSGGGGGPPWGNLPWRLGGIAAAGMGAGAGAAAASAPAMRPSMLADQYGY